MYINNQSYVQPFKSALSDQSSKLNICIQLNICHSFIDLRCRAKITQSGVSTRLRQVETRGPYGLHRRSTVSLIKEIMLLPYQTSKQNENISNKWVP